MKTCNRLYQDYESNAKQKITKRSRDKGNFKFDHGQQMYGYTVYECFTPYITS